MPISATDLNKAYLAYFGRPADVSGKQFFANKELADVVATFDGSAESQALYGGDTTAKINAIYNNLFNRDAEPAGLLYWLGQINSGKITPTGAALSILNGAAGSDATAVANKLAAADAFVSAIDTTAEIVGYSGMDAVASARTWLKSVDSTAASLTAAVAGAQAAVTAAAASGTGEGGGGYQLTSGTDVRSANVFTGGLVYTPGGDDRVNSLQDEDRLTGTGTNPTLNATLGNANDNGDTIVTPTLNGIQTVNVAFTGSGGNAVTGLDLQDATGLETVNVTRVTAASNTARIENIQSALDNMSVKNSNANNAGVIEFSFGANVLRGDNTGSLVLNNVQVATVNVGRNTSGMASGVGLQGYEQLTLESKGSTNSVTNLNLPMDTGTVGKLTITGTEDLTIGGSANIVNVTNNALLEGLSVYTANTGIAQAGGRIAAINASALDGDLTLVLDNVLDIGKAETSGVVQDVTVTGGKGNDTFVLYDAVQAGDVIDGGEGSDTLLFYAGSSIASVAKGMENASFLIDADTANTITADFDNLASITATTVRNIGSDLVGGVLVSDAEAGGTVTLYDMSAAQAAAITIQHATTGNNQIAQTTLEVAVKANTAADTLGVTIAEGLNVDQRSNFTIDTVVANTTTSTTASASTFENVTLTDSDSESNSVELQNFVQHTGTVKLTGGKAGTYLNLDVNTSGADVTNNRSGVDALATGVQQGLYGLDTDGAAVDLTTGSVIDVGALVTQVRLGAATIDASGEASNVIIRVSTNAASVVGAQNIAMGIGADTVIFDNLNDTRAGLTISDTVAGSTGADTLVIDGNGVNINLGASEWTNVSGFETMRLAGLGGAFNYTLTLTDTLIDTNAADGNLLNIISDNDFANDTASAADTVTIASSQESAVIIDARTLSASNSFTFNGEEGPTRVIDRFIFADANINGKSVIDGGAVDNVVATNSIANSDVIEVRNQAVATAGDLANIKNVGTIAFNNDQATAQRLTLQLNDTVIDSMVDSYHVSAATAGRVESLNVTLIDTGVLEVAGVGLDLDVTGITGKSALNVTLNNTAAGTAVDNLQLSASGGIVTVNNFDTVANGLAIPGGPDKIILSLSSFAAMTSVVGAGFSVGAEFVANATGVAGAAANRIVFDTVTGNLWYDADGSGVGQSVRIATLTGVADLAAADFTIIA